MRTARYPLRKPAPTPRLQPLWRQYAQESRRPLYCLIFLFPLVATYEFGAMLLRPVVWPERQLVAHSLILKLLAWFGAHGIWLPAVALLLTLLAWHVLEGYSWRIRGWVLPLMVLESAVLTLPLFVLGNVMTQAATAVAVPQLRHQIVLALGAGVYEELVFRLYLVTGLSLVLETGLRVPARFARPATVALSAATFAVCHFTPLGSEPFRAAHFLLLLLAGTYLAIVFVERGLGIAAGCHAAFNLIPLIVRTAL